MIKEFFANVALRRYSSKPLTSRTSMQVFHLHKSDSNFPIVYVKLYLFYR